MWLEGEAFFDVKHLNYNAKHIQPYERFIVHTKDLVVEVLGTSFNIRQRRGKTEVVLQTGKISISFNDKKHDGIMMSPGDIVTYNPTAEELLRTTTIPENYTAWRERKLLLNNPTVNEIVQYLEDNYGKKIVLDETQLGTRRIEGPILINNLDDALFILSTVLNVDIIKQDTTLFIRPR